MMWYMVACYADEGQVEQVQHEVVDPHGKVMMPWYQVRLVGVTTLGAG